MTIGKKNAHNKRPSRIWRQALRKKQKPSFKTLKNKLDAVFSQWIRRKNATSQGLAVCVTCHRVALWKELQCGHYLSRVHLSGRWLEKNCHVQCYSCNVARHGNYPAYAAFLKRKYGADVIDELESLARKVEKFSAYELEEKIAYYKGKLDELEVSLDEVGNH